MTRPSRTFKLRISPAGLDLLIASHCHSIRSTRSLIAWGTTLLVAVEYLDTISTVAVNERLEHVLAAGYAGREDHHLGAPRGVNETAARIAARVGPLGASLELPSLANIYFAALEQLTVTDPALLQATFERIKSSQR